MEGAAGPREERGAGASNSARLRLAEVVVVAMDLGLPPNLGAANARVWRACGVGPESSWRFPLPAQCAGGLADLAERLTRAPLPVVETKIEEAKRRKWSALFAPLLNTLENGRGYAVISGSPDACLGPDAQRALFWVVGQILGEPVTQNIQGVRLYDVRDLGQSVSEGARFSVTSYESTFHTDGSFEDDVIDYVGLLCVQTAKAGGLSQAVSGYTALAELAANAPSAVEILARPFHVDRRGGVRTGETPTCLRPVLTCVGDQMLLRYLRTWIEAGHQKAGEPLTDDQLRALDALDHTLNRDELRAEFMLRPGDMFFLNNRWILHNRTAFRDHPEPARRRHYVRLWLRNRERRPAGLS
jgi:hypothetical protein